MRRVLSTTLILALLAIASAVDVSFAFSYPKRYCKFDELMGETTKPLPVATIQKASEGEEDSWQPLRIKLSTKDLEGGDRLCRKENIFKEIVNLEGKEYRCEDYTMKPPGIADVRPNIDKILAQAVKLHTDRLSVKRAKGPIQLPKFETGVCQYFTVPEEFRNPGFSDADMVLFVGASSFTSSNIIVTGWAVPCAVNEEGRPVAGAINLISRAMHVSRGAVRNTAHQIAHALGFWHTMMQRLRMVDKLQVRTKMNYVSVVKSDDVRQAAQKHYNCSTAHGMEMEDGPHNDETQSHWEQRNAKDELMADFTLVGRTEPVSGLYTNLTLAAFHSMGFYRANFSKAEPMKWGRNAGCEFLQGSCWNDNGTIKYPDMFCSQHHHMACTTDRRSLGVCFMQNKADSLDRWNFYDMLSLSKMGEKRALTDFCPVHVTALNTCTRPDARSWLVFDLGSRVGDDSWCVDGEDLKVNYRGKETSINGVCVEVKCEDDKNIKVRYQGNDEWHDCPKDGKITPVTTGTNFRGGHIKCPKYEEVCVIGKEGESLVDGQTEKVAAL